MQALCAFLNESGGTVVIGVGPDGKLLGQVISVPRNKRLLLPLTVLSLLRRSGWKL